MVFEMTIFFASCCLSVCPFVTEQDDYDFKYLLVPHGLAGFLPFQFSFGPPLPFFEVLHFKSGTKISISLEF